MSAHGTGAVGHGGRDRRGRGEGRPRESAPGVGRPGEGPGTERPAPDGDRPVVGVIGLGTMGGAMARHLLGAGFSVVGHDVSPAATQACRSAGATTVANAANVAAAADVVILSLPSVAAFEAVVGGPGGLLDAAPPRARVVVEASTLPLDVKVAGHARLATAGMELVDCPVSGTGAQMAVGDAVFYASGDASAVLAAKPVLAACGKGVFDVGPFGKGTELKLVSNHLVGIHNAAAAEALTLAECAGIDPAAALPALVAGAGMSRMLEVRGPMMVAKCYEPPSATVRIFLKDIGIITDFARTAGCSLPVFEAAATLHRTAEDAGWGNADPASVHAVVDRRGGPHLR